MSTPHTFHNSIETIEATVSGLTAKGRETMEAIGRRQLSFFDDGIVAGSGIWGENLTGEMGHKSSGVINRLKKLGLLESNSENPGYETRSDWWWLTQLGADVANYLASDENPEPVATPDQVEENTRPMSQEDVNTLVWGETTARVGKKWTYLYNAAGELIAELRNDALAEIASSATLYPFSH